MMGPAHALTGAATAAAIYAGQAGQFDPITLIIGGFMVTGGALLPDIDHPNATATRTFGPVTGAFSWLVNTVSGGHRRGTHSLTGVAVLAGLTQVGLMYRHGAASLLLVVTMILALASVVRLWKIPGYLDDLAPIPIVLGLVYLTPVPLWYVPPALAIGAMVHIIGDMITPEGCPIWWPVSAENHGVGLIQTGGTVERYVISPACIAVVLAGVYLGGFR